METSSGYLRGYYEILFINYLAAYRFCVHILINDPYLEIYLQRVETGHPRICDLARKYGVRKQHVFVKLKLIDKYLNMVKDFGDLGFYIDTRILLILHNNRITQDKIKKLTFDQIVSLPEIGQYYARYLEKALHEYRKIYRRI